MNRQEPITLDQTYTICAFTENSPGVLQRITVLFTRRKFNIESLTVSETERQGISRFTIVVRGERDVVEKVARQIARIVEVLEVSVHENADLIYREIALIEVQADTPRRRAEVARLAQQSGAQIVREEEQSVVLEKTGSEEEIHRLYGSLEHFGIAQFVRSGRIALRCGN